MPSPPSFQFYPKQWLGDDRVMLMDWDARGMHMHLMCLSWQQPITGSIPDDDAALRRWCGNPSLSNWLRVKAQILSAWRLEGGRWYQDGLVRERARQIAKREAGAKGGRPPGSALVPDVVNQTGTEAKTKPEPKDNLHARVSSSSSSTSSSSSPSGETVSNDTGSGRSKKRVVVDAESPPDFGDLEPDVKALIRLAAAKNNDGKISVERIATIRRHLQKTLGKVGSRDALAYGLSESIGREIGDPRYVAKVAGNYQPLLDAGAVPKERKYATAASVLAEIGNR